MSAFSVSILAVWVVFWLYWLIASRSAKARAGGRRSFAPGLRIALVAFVLLRIFRAGGLTVHDAALRALGAIVLAGGLALAVWARVHLGRNWGMPMSEKDEPELVTSGPYRLVRHPIYTGILLGMLGTALATNLYWLVAFAVSAPYFLYSARVEEGIMARAFPSAYPGYRARTKMLIPFVL
ncbi:MAG TPA: isoprenylcysteine carboxylmethyltransferase family protein [Solirubrobacteraceae bacterium]|nr:isoprenylcysteine carboxylmethyltransferase family protein [Solirubrobacteraceae bacterium]